MRRLRTCAVTVSALISAIPAFAQSQQYNFDLPRTCAIVDVFGCSRAQPVVNPDGSFVGATSATAPGFNRSTGAANYATGQVALNNSTPTLIAAARPGRSRITITSTSAVVFYVGGSNVTASTGAYIAGAAGASKTIQTQAAIYGIGAAALTVTYDEEF